MKIKTNELTGIALDWAVTKIEEPDALRFGVEDWREQRRSRTKGGEYQYRWHTSWNQGGPLIELESICLSRWTCGWDACMTNGPRAARRVNGDTPLIAAMRCFVASRLGDEVDIPVELL
jgi:hypothetical protein